MLAARSPAGVLRTHHVKAVAARAAPRPRQLCIAAVFAPSTTNPAFTGFGNLDEAIVESRYAAKRPLTLNGTVNKTAALLALCAASAAATWVQLLTGGPAAFGAVLGATKVAGIVAMVSALASMFKPLWSGVTGPVYALAKGVALAGVSAYAELMVPGIALNTVLLTLCTAGSLLFGLRSGLIRVTDQFGDAVRAATGGFFISMLAVLVMGMFGIRFPSLLTSGPLAIGVSLVSAGLAAANLLLDFDYVKQAAASRAVSEKLEWYMAQSTLFTLVWFYTSLLRLMMLLSGGRDD